jgi:hypothetical protein
MMMHAFLWCLIKIQKAVIRIKLYRNHRQYVSELRYLDLLEREGEK